jgi:replicative DNA helicase
VVPFLQKERGYMLEDLQHKYEEIISNDVEHEQLLLGCMLSDEVAFEQAAKILKVDNFAIKHSKHIFHLLQSAYEKGEDKAYCNQKLNSITETDWKSIDSSMRLTRQEYVTTSLTKAITIPKIEACVESMLKKMQEQYIRRTMYARYIDALEKLLDTKSSEGVHNVVNSVVDDSKSNLELLAIDNQEETFFQQALRILNTKEAKSISTGYKQLDKIIGGFKGGQLITIGAGTGMGKSAFAVNIALNILRQEYGVAIWSFEMDEYEVVQRLFSVQTGKSYKTERYQEERYNLIRKFLEELSQELIIRTQPIKDLSLFYLDCQKGMKKKNLKVVIIDYLQLIHLSGSNKKATRVAEIEYITNSFKNIANELGLVIIILSQLSREHQRREDKTPILSDLRDSGSIEQDSNIVMFLSNLPEKLTPRISFSKWEKPMALHVSKNRSGSTGFVKFKYTGYITKFTELVEDDAVVA